MTKRSILGVWRPIATAPKWCSIRTMHVAVNGRVHFSTDSTAGLGFVQLWTHEGDQNAVALANFGGTEPRPVAAARSERFTVRSIG
jgi:hypothetical protein